MRHSQTQKVWQQFDKFDNALRRIFVEIFVDGSRFCRDFCSLSNSRHFYRFRSRSFDTNRISVGDFCPEHLVLLISCNILLFSISLHPLFLENLAYRENLCSFVHKAIEEVAIWRGCCLHISITQILYRYKIYSILCLYIYIVRYTYF